MAQILILWGLVWLVKTDYTAKYAAVIYACIAGFLNYIFTYPEGITSALITALVYFITSWIYFWAVQKTINYPLIHWAIIIGGVAIGLV